MILLFFRLPESKRKKKSTITSTPEPEVVVLYKEDLQPEDFEDIDEEEDLDIGDDYADHSTDEDYLPEYDISRQSKVRFAYFVSIQISIYFISKS